MLGKGEHPAGSAKRGVSGEAWSPHEEVPASGGGAGMGSLSVPGGGAGGDNGIWWLLDLLK